MRLVGIIHALWFVNNDDGTRGLHKFDRGTTREAVTFLVDDVAFLLLVRASEVLTEGINIDDCVLVSNHLSDLLAVEHDIDYDRLEVSSPGLDRALKKEADFVRFNGERAQVKLRVPVEGRKNFVGILRGLEQDQLAIECEGVLHHVALSNIDKAKLAPEF